MYYVGYLVAEFLEAPFVDEEPLRPGAVLAHVLPHAPARGLHDAIVISVFADLLD
jgi:hypothetical protein